ncbi:MAG: hypothetical protein ACOY31_04960 [Bacillota bacterium]
MAEGVGKLARGSQGGQVDGGLTGGMAPAFKEQTGGMVMLLC